MKLNKYLYPDEKKYIDNLSPIQSAIVERREVLFRIMNNKESSLNIKKNINKTSDNVTRKNADAFQKILENEGLLIDKPILTDVTFSEKDNITEITKEYYSIIVGINAYTKSLSSDMKYGLSSVDQLEPILKDLKKHYTKLYNYNKSHKLGDNLNTRFLSLIGYLSGLNNLIDESSNDIVDFYTNKTAIVNSLNTITNNSKGILQMLQKMYK